MRSSYSLTPRSWTRSRCDDDAKPREPAARTRVELSGRLVVVRERRLFIEPHKKGFGRRHSIGVVDEFGNLFPVDGWQVEAYAEPASFARVARNEEPIRLVSCQFGIYSRRCFTGQRNDPVAVMIVEVPREPFLADSKPDVLVGVAADLGYYLGERFDQVDESLAVSIDVHDGTILVRRNRPSRQFAAIINRQPELRAPFLPADATAA